MRVFQDGGRSPLLDIGKMGFASSIEYEGQILYVGRRSGHDLHTPLRIGKWRAAEHPSSIEQRELQVAIVHVKKRDDRCEARGIECDRSPCQ